MSRISAHLRTFAMFLAWTCGVFVVVCSLSFAPETRAANGSITQQITYQAKLLDASSFPVSDGNYTIKFSVYDASSGGNRLWTATGTIASPGAINVSSTNGLFTINLGDTSSGGQWQNALPNDIWNKDSLFLGVTIGSDSEMSPRRRLASVPQAYNSMQLQGMYASSTAYGGQALFTIHQTETSAATGTRTALLIQSEGTSAANDFLLRGVASDGSSVLTAGVSGDLFTSGTVTSSKRLVGLTDVLVGTSTYGGGLNALYAINGNDLLVDGNIGSVSSVYTNGAFVAGTGSTYYGNGFINKNDGNLTLQASGGYIFPATTLGVSLGSSSLLYNGYFGNVTTTEATSTYLSTTSASTSLLMATYGTSSYFGGNEVRLQHVTTTSLSSSYLRFDWTTTTVAYATSLEAVSASSTYTSTTYAYTNNFQVVSASTTFATSSFIGVNNTFRKLLTAQSTITVASTTVINSPNTATPYDMAVAGHYLYVADRDRNLVRILDISDPVNPSSTGSVTVTDPTSVAVAGKYIYATASSSNQLSIIEVTSTAAPTVVGTLTLTQPVDSVLYGKYLYVSEYGGNSFAVVDVSNPTSPSLVKRIASLSLPWGMAVAQERLYVTQAGGGKLTVYNITDPVNPNLIGSITGLSTPTDIKVRDRYAYVAQNGSSNILIYDVSFHGVPRLITTFALGATPRENALALYGRYLYVVTQSNDLRIVDVQDPQNVSLIKTVSVGTGPESVAVQGRFAYVGNYTGASISVVDITGAEINALVAHGAYVGGLDVNEDARVEGNAYVNGSLFLGNRGLFANGPVVSSASSSSSTSQFVNNANADQGTTWGAYINRLLVGQTGASTGTADFSQVITYNSNNATGSYGLCIDDLKTVMSCLAVPSNTASIQADGTINANAFDLAERYAMSGVVSPGDLLVLDSATSATVKASTGVPYDGNVIGIASLNPGFLLGFVGGAQVALTGRVPAKFSPANGSVAIGDSLTSSYTPGMVMKATKPGRIVGYALEAANATTTVETFVRVGYEAGMTLAFDGTVTRVTDHLVLAPQATASAAHPTQDSWGFTLRGSAWDGSQAVTSDFTLVNTIVSSTSSAFTIRNTAATSVFSIDQTGIARVTGDLIVGGRLFPSSRGAPQTDAYLFVDHPSVTSTYIATNADGWQSNTSYDFAERYYSPDALEPGDLVIVSHSGRAHVQRSWDERTPTIGIVSTRPGFVAGAPATSTFPIALAGRVPTKVSTVKGAIHAGDMLAPSTIPGVAVKATIAGPVVGQALEPFDGGDVGKIEVFVNPIWWGGEDHPVVATPVASTTTTAVSSQSLHGMAVIAAGAMEVRVSFPSLRAFPNVLATPRGEVDGGWWTDAYTDTGFVIRLRQAQTHDVIFAWRVEPTEDGEQAFLSDGTRAPVQPLTGEIVAHPIAATSTAPIVVPTETPTSTILLVTPEIAAIPASSTPQNDLTTTSTTSSTNE